MFRIGGGICSCCYGLLIVRQERWPPHIDRNPRHLCDVRSRYFQDIRFSLWIRISCSHRFLLSLVSSTASGGRWSFLWQVSVHNDFMFSAILTKRYAVITELDGLSKNPSALGNAANDALGFLISAVPAYSVSLKVQTSKGNYLRNLSVRSESINFRDGISQDRNMDDLILRSALWQAEHFVDRQYTLSGVDNIASDTAPTSSTSKVVLLSFDRNRASFIFVLFLSILNVASSSSEGAQSKVGCRR